MLLVSLAEELLGEVLSYGVRRDVCNVGAAHRSLAVAVRENEYLWQQMLQRDWPAAVAPAPQQPQEESDRKTDAEGDDDGMMSEDGAGTEDSRVEYRRMAIKFGRAGHCYPRVAAVWRRLESWLAINASRLPPIASTLAPPARSIQDLDKVCRRVQSRWKTLQVETRRHYRREVLGEPDDAVDAQRSSKRQKNDDSTSASAAQDDDDDEDQSMAFEAALGLSSAPPSQEEAELEIGADATEVDGMPLSDLHLPDELLCSMLMHNGQTDVVIREHLFTGLFGGYSFYHFHVNFRLTSLRDLLEVALDNAEKETGDLLDELAKNARQHRRRKSTGSIPAGATTTAAMDASAAAAGSVATQFASATVVASAASSDLFSDVDLLYPLTSSPIGSDDVCFFLRRDGRVVRRDHDGEMYEVAASFVDFMERHVSDLEQGVFAHSPERGINRFPLAHVTCSDTTTRGVRIQVSVLFVPEQSTRSKYFFTYRVRVMHDGTTPVRATLTTRHWEITDAHDQTEFVDGPGVIGEYPSVYEGCPVFIYESCCPISTSSGRVRGWFTFKDDYSDDTFQALISPFTLDAARNYC